MSVTTRIGNVPDALYCRLLARAAIAGVSLSDCLLDEISRIADRPTPDEMRERLESRAAPTLAMSPAEAVRDGRGGR